MSKADPEHLRNEADASIKLFAQDAANAEENGQYKVHLDASCREETGQHKSHAEAAPVETLLEAPLQEASGTSRPASEHVSVAAVDPAGQPKAGANDDGDSKANDALSTVEDCMVPMQTRDAAEGTEGVVAAVEDGNCKANDALSTVEDCMVPTQSGDAEHPSLLELEGAGQGLAKVSPRTRSLEEEQEQEEAMKAPSSPPPPEKVSVGPFGPGTIKICWDPVEHTPNVTHYAILLKHDGIKEFVHGASGTMVQNKSLAGPVGAHTTILTVNGLTAGTAYKARVAAKNEVGWGAYSDYSSYFTLKEAPLAPNQPCIMALTASSIRVSWPTLGHSSPILNYKLQVHDGTMSRFFDPCSTKLVRSETAAGTLPAHTTSVVVTGLTPKVPYRARVSAQSVEWGPYSSLSEAVAIAEPPRPQRPELTLVGISAARISWTAISDLPEVSHYAIIVEEDGTSRFFRPDGGRVGKDVSEVNGRLVSTQKDSAAVPRQVTAILVPGVSLGRTYKARVVGKNIIGWGVWSKSSKPVMVKPNVSASVFGISSILQDDGATEVQDSYAESVQAPEAPIGPDSP